MTTTITNTEARVNITHGGSNGDLPDTVSFDAADGDVKQWVTEAVRGGGVPGIALDVRADFTDFVVDRFTANEARPYNLIAIRPKTPFGTIFMGDEDDLDEETKAEGERIAQEEATEEVLADEARTERDEIIAEEEAPQDDE